MSRDDLVRVRHILDAAREAVSFIEGKSRADLDLDRKLNLSLVRLLEIIGEAGRSVSDEMRAVNPEIGWSQMAGMRNRLIHGYFDVDLDAVWETVTRDLPPLIKALEKLLPSR